MHLICLLSKIFVLITFNSLKRKIGKGLPIPKGSIFLISLNKLLLNAKDEISASYLEIKLFLLRFFKKSLIT